jgi:hypothetical protein
MHRLAFVVLLAPHAAAADAFDADISLGSVGTATHGQGVAIHLEARRNLGDDNAIGLRGEAMVAGPGDSGWGEDRSVVAALATAEHRFHHGPSGIRAFVGIAAGAYKISSFVIGPPPSSATRGPGEMTIGCLSGGASYGDTPELCTIHNLYGTFFGVAPTIGVDLGHVRIALTYNVLAGAHAEIWDGVTTDHAPTSSFRQDYATFDLAYRFGD